MIRQAAVSVCADDVRDSAAADESTTGRQQAPVFRGEVHPRSAACMFRTLFLESGRGIHDHF